MALSLKQKLLLGFGALILGLLALGVLSYSSINSMLEADIQVDHTTDVIYHLQKLDLELKRAQASYRAYLLLPRPELLKTAEFSLALAEKTAQEARDMTQDNPRQVENFSRFIPLLESRLRMSQTNLQLCRSGRTAEALARFKDPQNFRSNDELNNDIGQMVTEEQNILAKRRDREASYARVSLLILVSGALVAILFAFGSIFTIRREIQKRAQVQEVLMLNEHRLFQFLEAVPLGIFVMDKAGKPFYANQKARELLGKGILPLSDSQDLSTLYGAFVAGTDQAYPSDRIPMVRALKGERSSIEDIEIHRPDGSIVPLQVWGTPVYGLKGEIQYALAIFSDITERRHVEEMKQSLISVVSHQLKTPVGEINGYIENLLEGLAGGLTPKQAEYLQDMKEIGMNNYRLISDLLNLSKIERGLITSSLERLALIEVVEMAMRDYDGILAHKKLSFALRGFEEPLYVMADRDKLVETLRNLISNAIKFTDKGGLTLEAEAKDRMVLLRVKDTGQGISQAAMAQLFSQKRVLGEEAGRAGAGLGLYVAKHFMRAMGGDITATTEPGKGTTFTLTIPRA
ncbi:MAG TPA: ATP-binding protein [bacterium]|nr:ATP-binding protein [bacterium]